MIITLKEVVGWSLIIVGFVVTVGLAISRYIIDNRNRIRQERLARIDLQIQKLYGPLLTIIQTKNIGFEIFSQMHDMSSWIRGEKWKEQSIPELSNQPWMDWVRKDFLLNEKIYNLIVENSHLIIEYQMPDCFKTFVVHYTQYRIIISNWDKDDYSILFSDTPYPYREMLIYLSSSFQLLKTTQYNLLGHNHSLNSQTSFEGRPRKKKKNHEEPVLWGAE